VNVVVKTVAASLINMESGQVIKRLKPSFQYTAVAVCNPLLCLPLVKPMLFVLSNLAKEQPAVSGDQITTFSNKIY